MLKCITNRKPTRLISSRVGTLHTTNGRKDGAVITATLHSPSILLSSSNSNNTHSSNRALAEDETTIK
jgi:hypothetical protein